MTNEEFDFFAVLNTVMSISGLQNDTQTYKRIPITEIQNHCIATKRIDAEKIKSILENIPIRDYNIKNIIAGNLPKENQVLI